MDIISLKTFLYNRRIDLHLSLRQAAKKIGISHTYLAMLEKGVDPRTNLPLNPTPEVLTQISVAYEVDYNYLLDLVGYIHSPLINEQDGKPNTDIELVIMKTLSTLEKQDHLVFHGEPIDENEWNRIKCSIIVGLECATRVK